MKNVEGEAITVRTAESGVTCAAGILIPTGARRGLREFRSRPPDEVEPPFLNGSNDILGAEALNHWRHGEPVAEPLALRIPHNGRRLEEYGHDIRPRQNEKY